MLTLFLRLIFFADLPCFILLVNMLTLFLCLIFLADLICSICGIGAPFLYLLCFAKVKNSQLMERFDEVNRRIDGQDETLKSIQSTLAELTSAVKALVKTQDTKEVKEPGPDVSLIIDAEESDEQLHNDGEEKESSSAINRVTKLEFPSFETVFANFSDSLNSWKMSGQRRYQDNRFAAGKSDVWRKPTNAGPRPEWKPKTKESTDVSSSNASSNQKADSSLSSSSFTPKPDLNPHSQEESQSPSVKNASFVTENYKPIPDSSQKADNDSTQPKSVTTFDQTSKNSNHLFPIPTKSHQGTELQDEITEKGKQIGDISKPEDTTHASSFTTFDICPKKVKTGVVQLKPSLLVKNREKRNQMKRASEGPNIIILKPGMVLMKGYISCDDQVKIVKTCRELGIGDGGFYQPGYRDGSKLHLRMMCLGKNWDPQSSEYSEIRTIDNSKPPKIPDFFHDMVKRAIQESNDHIKKNKGKVIPSMLPDICIVNFYTKSGKLGLHQDKDESRESLNRGLPVVSFSIGDSGEFLYGKGRDIEKTEKVNLESGDVLIYGGESRHIFHGVSSIVPETAPKSLLEATDMRDGRLNLTFRQF